MSLFTLTHGLFAILFVVLSVFFFIVVVVVVGVFVVSHSIHRDCCRMFVMYSLCFVSNDFCCLGKRCLHRLILTPFRYICTFCTVMYTKSASRNNRACTEAHSHPANVPFRLKKLQWSENEPIFIGRGRKLTDSKRIAKLVQFSIVNILCGYLPRGKVFVALTHARICLFSIHLYFFLWQFFFSARMCEAVFFSLLFSLTFMRLLTTDQICNEYKSHEYSFWSNDYRMRLIEPSTN